jgi:isoquinoline 1-oxidoreductase beta subunit
VKRRTFLLTGLTAGGALVLGWATLGPRQRIRGSGPLPTTGGEVPINGWVKIAPDETVTVIVPKSEMGQGIHTACAMILAEELDADWSRVRVEHAPIDAIYNNIAAVVDALPMDPDNDGVIKQMVRTSVANYARERGFMFTGGSSSVTDTWEPMRNAGAMARAALRAAAAAQWNVLPEACRVEQGAVILNDRRLTFGALATAAREYLPDRWSLKSPQQFTLIGTSPVRLDAAAKANGTAIFGLDAGPADRLYAAVALPPSLGATVARYDEAKAKALSGVVAVVPFAGGRYGSRPGVAVVATNWHIARQGVDALAVQWTEGEGREFSSREAALDLEARAVRNDGKIWRNDGDVVEAYRRAVYSVEASYGVPYLAHAPMEPENCTVVVRDGAAEVWTGTQVPSIVRRAVAAICDLDEADVTLHQQLLGGGFGRRQIVDFVANATEIAKALPGRAVQLLWTREQDIQQGPFRPINRARLTAALDGDGRITALTSASASQSMVQGWSRYLEDRIAQNFPEKTTVEGLIDQPYTFPALRVVHDRVDLPVPVLNWRAVGHSYTGFYLESFIDECAAVKQLDPITYRLAMLASSPRARAVLTLAAEKAGWDAPLAPAALGARAGRGVALRRCFNAYIAQIAEVEISADRQLRVRRVVAAIDCGYAVNPDGVKQQLESGIIFGLSAALHGEISIEKGRVAQSNLHEYRPLRLSETPVIETHIVVSDEPPGGVGEVGVAAIAPAVTNAIFAAGGGRIRALPIRLEKAEVVR